MKFFINQHRTIFFSSCNLQFIEWNPLYAPLLYNFVWEHRKSFGCIWPLSMQSVKWLRLSTQNLSQSRLKSCQFLFSSFSCGPECVLLVFVYFAQVTIKFLVLAESA